MKGIKFVLLCMILIVLVLAVSGGGSVSAAVVNVSDSNNTSQIQAALDGASDGDVINFSAGTYSDVYLMINKPLTLVANTGDYRTSGVVLTNDSKFDIKWAISNVAIKGFVFENITTNLSGLAKFGEGNATILPLGRNHNITVEKNKLYNTSRSGIGAWSCGANPVFNFSLIDNNFSLIGHNLPPNYSIERRSRMTAVKMCGVNDSSFRNNFIDGTTWSGMNLVNIYNSEISGNEIYRTAKNGIQIAKSVNSNTSIKDNVITYSNTDRTRMRQERKRLEKINRAGGGGERIEILNNNSANFNYSIVRLVETNMKAGVSIDGSSNVLVENNTIAHNHDGIIVCPSDCSVFDPHYNFNEHEGYYGDTSANITRNRIYNNSGSFRSLYYNGSSGYPNDTGTGRNIIFGFSGRIIDVSRNYWGENPESLFIGPRNSFEGRYYANVNFSPYYADMALTNLVEWTTDDDDDDGGSGSSDDDDDDDGGSSRRAPPPVVEEKPSENKTENNNTADNETIVLVPEKNETGREKEEVVPVPAEEKGNSFWTWFLSVLVAVVVLVVVVVLLKKKKRKKSG